MARPREQQQRSEEEEEEEEAAVDMEPSIWGLLPDELLERILALLPLRTLLALRPTCKRFHSLLFSPSFLSLLQSHSSPAILLLCHPHFFHSCLPVYDSATAAWRSVVLSPSSSSADLLVSASSGLLCFSLPSSRGPALLIHNILTNNSKTVALPTTNSASATLVSLPSSSPHGYKIFLPSATPDSVFVYDSVSGTWTRFPGFGPVVGRGNSNQVGVFFEGALYLTTAEPFTVVAFDLVTGVWDDSVAPALPAELAFVRLVGTAGGDRLFLVGGIGSDGISRSLKVWELVGEKGEGKARAWEEVGRLPEMMCRKFVSVCYHNYSHVHCLWYEGLVCVCCTTWPEVLFCKVARGTWHWQPRCPMLPEKWICGFRWFSFLPDLYALV